MEAFEKAAARDSLRLDKSILDPVVVKSLNDIKRVIAEYDPGKDKDQSSLPLSTILESSDDGGKMVKYSVKASTKSKSKRQIILEGLDLIKNRAEKLADEKDNIEEFEVNGKAFKPAKLHNNTSGMSWVDPLIKQWFGGKRKETYITWDIGDGYEYKYDIYAHSLSRIEQR